MQDVRGGVNVKILKLHGKGNKLIEPRKADMASDNDEFRKVEQHVFEIGNGTPRFRAFEWSSMADLCAEWHACIHASGVDRVIVPIVRWQIPKPRYNTHANEGLTVDPLANLAAIG